MRIIQIFSLIFLLASVIFWLPVSANSNHLVQQRFLLDHMTFATGLVADSVSEMFSGAGDKVRYLFGSLTLSPSKSFAFSPQNLAFARSSVTEIPCQLSNLFRPKLSRCNNTQLFDDVLPSEMFNITKGNQVGASVPLPTNPSRTAVLNHSNLFVAVKPSGNNPLSIVDVDKEPLLDSSSGQVAGASTSSVVTTVVPIIDGNRLINAREAVTLFLLARGSSLSGDLEDQIAEVRRLVGRQSDRDTSRNSDNNSELESQIADIIDGTTITGDSVFEQNLSVQGNFTVGGNLEVVGAQTLTGALGASYLTATDAAQTSVFAGGLSVAGQTDLGGVLYVDAVNGRVGIGVEEPTATLDVDGNVNLSGNLNIKGLRTIYLPSDSFSGTLYVGNGGGSLVKNSGSQGDFNTAIGVFSLFSNTTGSNNTSIGYASLFANTSGSFNASVGSYALFSNTIGSYNNALGYQALLSNTSGNFNSAYGHEALRANTSGNDNSAFGLNAMRANTNASFNTGLGVSALQNNSTGPSNTAVGYYAGRGATNASNFIGNTLVGSHSGTNLRTGADYNTLLGFQSGDSITTGARNIIIGHNTDTPTATSSDRLNIGNTIYGDLTTGNVGIGTIAPGQKLSIEGASLPYISINTNNIANKRSGMIFQQGGVNQFEMGIDHDQNNTTDFYIYDSVALTHRLIINSSGGLRLPAYGLGNLQTDALGNVTSSSDERLKDVRGGYSRGLEDLTGIEPIAYKWESSTGYDTDNIYYGFSAQNVEISIPEAVGLDPLGYRTLSDRPILAAAINAIKELDDRTGKVVNGLKTFVTDIVEATIGRFNRVEVKDELCIGGTCINESELKDLLELRNQQNSGPTIMQSISNPNPPAPTTTSPIPSLNFITEPVLEIATQEEVVTQQTIPEPVEL